MKFLLAFLTLTFTAGAFADQCQLVSQQKAESAVEFLKPGTKIGSLCEPCGETKIKRKTVRSVSIAQRSDGEAMVIVNGKPVDLAYTYYLANGSRYYNIAGLIGCPAEGVTFDIKK